MFIKQIIFLDATHAVSSTAMPEVTTDYNQKTQGCWSFSSAPDAEGKKDEEKADEVEN